MKVQKKKATRPRRAWNRLRSYKLSLNPCCQICGERSALQVHHVVPFSQSPELYLVLSNLVTLCGSPNGGCHLRLGHNGNYSFHNLNILNYVSNSNKP